MIGQLFDLFDGRAAQKHGSTPIGPWLDDLADFVSFGICPALMILAKFYWHWTSIVVSAVYVLAIAYRLLRFVLVDRQNSILANTFSGLPSPAAAALVMGFTVVLSKIAWLAIVSVLISLASISTAHFSHFGRLILKHLPRALLVFMGSIIVLAIAFIIKYRHLNFLGYFLLIGSLLYVFLGRMIKE